MATERKIPEIIANAFSVFSSCTNCRESVGSLKIINIEIAKEAPRSSKTKETVVDVGNPRVLKKSSRKTSVIMAATKIYITSAKTNLSGLKIPLRAISIIPLLSEAPMTTPKPATNKITFKGAALLPTEELMKLTASLLTPTIKSNTAKQSINTTKRK